MDNSTKAAPFQWDDEKIACVIRLKGEGLSASEIAGELGTTKGSVLGKLRRLGLFEPKTNGGSALKGRAYVARKRKILAKNGNPHLPPGSVSLLDLKAEDCRFPVTDRPPHLFCAKPKWGSSSYCAFHTSRVWRNFEEPQS
jgi:GcrA cell cycle regulator